MVTSAFSIGLGSFCLAGGFLYMWFIVDKIIAAIYDPEKARLSRGSIAFCFFVMTMLFVVACISYVIAIHIDTVNTAIIAIAK